jgi:UPF0716 protein FxsA
LLFLAMVVEITVLVVVGQAIGLLATILLLIAASVVGMWLLRREGSRTFAAFQEALRTRRIPHREMADGVLIAAAGALILIPGFVSDLIALFLLFPPTRAIVSRRITRRAQPPAAFGGGFVVDGDVIGNNEIDRRP